MWKRILTILIIFVCAPFMTGCGFYMTPIEARVIEEIWGTYEVQEYVLNVSGKETDLGAKFDYLYMILDSDSHMQLVYKEKSAKSYSASERLYTAGYKTGSIDLVQEIKATFKMPLSFYESEAVYVFSVSSGHSLVCQSSLYELPPTSGADPIRKLLILDMKRVSDDQSYGYIEAAQNITVDNVVSPYRDMAGSKYGKK